MKKSTRKELEDQIKVISDASMGYDVGSEEFLNACKAENQLAEAAGKLKVVNADTMIGGGVSIAMFLLYMAFSDTHITDTRAISFCKSLFRK